MALPAKTALRAAVIAAIQADAGCQATALGSSPRVYNRVPTGAAFPFLRVDDTITENGTATDEGAVHSLILYVEGEYQGDKEAEVIFEAVRRLLRDFAPRSLSDHRLVNLQFEFEDVQAGEDGKRYFGLQRWRAVTEET